MAAGGWGVAVEQNGKQWQCYDVKIDRGSYPQMKAWFSRMVSEWLPPELITPETNPISSLEAIEARSPAKARAGLAMAIGDIVEDTDGWSLERLESIDELLSRDGLPTLTEIRLRFSKVINRVVKRGSIKNDIEYYAVRNAADRSHAKAEDLWPLLEAYEHSQPRQ